MVAVERKRMTFTVTSDMEELLVEAKKMFYGMTRSEMICALIVAGLAVLGAERGSEEKAKGKIFTNQQFGSTTQSQNG